MKRVCNTLFFSLAFLAFTSLGNASTILMANLTIFQENPVPSVTLVTGAPRPAPTGTAMFVINDAMTQMTMSVTVSNIDFTGSQTTDPNDDLVAAHIHAGALAPPGNNPVVWGFFGTPFNETDPNDRVLTPSSTGVGGTITGKWDATEGNNTTLALQIPNILAGRSYINFHTTQNPGGELRGNIFVVPEPATFSLLGVGSAVMLVVRRRRAKQ